MANSYHNPVMLSECMEMLDVSPEGIFVDLTFGGGGHTSEMLRRGAKHVYAFDQDADAEKNAENIKQENLTFVRSNFRYLTNWLHYHGVTHVDGILADLGVSSHQFDELSRGFSFRGDAPVDMRMNQRQPKTANDILNLYTEEQLADTFYLYGELKQARRIASAIVKARSANKTTNVTYYAHWTATTYVVTLDPNGGNVNPTTKNVTYNNTYGDLPTPTKTGYTFAGWYTSVNGGTNITSTSQYTTAGVQTLYAHWTAVTYLVTFDPNGGSVNPTTKNVTYNTEYGTLPTPTRTSYTFDGWYTSVSGGTKVTSTTNYTNVGAQTLYAHWTGVPYNIVYNANGGNGSMSNQTLNYGVSSNLSSNTFEKTGYAFLEWNTKSDGTGTSYSNGQSVINLSSQSGSVINLYAIWTYANIAIGDPVNYNSNLNNDPGWVYIGKENGRIMLTSTTPVNSIGFFLVRFVMPTFFHIFAI